MVIEGIEYVIFPTRNQATFRKFMVDCCLPAPRLGGAALYAQLRGRDAATHARMLGAGRLFQ